MPPEYLYIYIHILNNIYQKVRFIENIGISHPHLTFFHTSPPPVSNISDGDNETTRLGSLHPLSKAEKLSTLVSKAAYWHQVAVGAKPVGWFYDPVRILNSNVKLLMFIYRISEISSSISTKTLDSTECIYKSDVT